MQLHYIILTALFCHLGPKQILFTRQPWCSFHTRS